MKKMSSLQEEFKQIRKRQLAKEVAADKKLPGTGKKSRKRKIDTALDIDSDDSNAADNPE